MVTGSHNPAGYNGFKIVLGGTTLAGQAVGVNVFTLLCDHANSVAITIQGDPQIGIQTFDSRDQIPQVLGNARVRVMVWESSVHLTK